MYRIASLYVALFLSGAAALVYQSTWGRMLQRVFGVSDLAVATVLATFFLGLGLGSALGGRWGERIQRSARLYAILEVAIGAWALLSLLLIPRVHDLYAAVGTGLSFTALTFVRFLIAVFILLPPTLLMGATLPILIKAVSRRGVEWSSAATWLYATNTFGAVLGAGATGLYLVPVHGARTSVVVAALASFSAAAIVYAMWRTNDPAPAEAEKSEARPSGPLPRSVKVAMLLAAVAGVASLASEVLWTRVLRLVVQGTTQAFAAMLVNFLIGIALGSLIAERLMRKPGRSATHLFAMTQIGLALLTGFAIWVGSQMPRIAVIIQEAPMIVPHQAWVILAMSAILLLPLAIMLGTSIPLAWRIAGGDATDAPSYSGKVLAANTLGGLFGSLMAGFLLIPGFAALLRDSDPAEIRVSAVELSLMVVLFIHLLAATIAFRTYAKTLVGRVAAMTAPLAVGIAIIAIGPSLNLPFLLDAWYDPTSAVINGPQEHWRNTVTFLEEGRNTTVSVLQRDSTLRLFNDGRPESGFGVDDPGFGEELAMLGSLPVVLSAEHERAMIVGLGAGHTTAVTLGGPWERVDVVELENAVVNAARYLYESRSKPFPLDDPRANEIVDDARAQLVLAEESSYDAVISQPSHPWLAGSSALYTREFFAEVDRALKDTGVFTLWTNLFRIDMPHLKSIVATLFTSFDHVHAWVVEDSSFILTASDSPIELGQRAADMISSEGLQPYLRPFALDDIVDYAATMELDTASARAWCEGAEIIVDDRPALEFDLARIPHEQDLSQSDVDYSLRELPWMTRESFETIPESVRVEVLIQRVEYEGIRLKALARVTLAIDELGLSESDEHLVRGVIAEQRGNLSGALEQYDGAMQDDRVAIRADQLREAERLWRSLLESLDRPRADPATLKPFFVAALWRRDRAAAQRILSMDETPADSPLAAVTRAWVADDCAALIAAVEQHDRALDAEPAALEAARCAYAAGDVDAGLRYTRRYHRAARAEAAAAARDASAAMNAFNKGLAMRYYRRALNAYPGHASSAAGLARMLDQGGRTAEAEQLLKDCYVHARGLPSASQTLRTAAEELGVSLD